MDRKSSQSGQIALLVLLIIVFAVAVALSLIGRTTQNVSISTQLDESAKALSTAEAGLNLAMNSGTGISKTEIAPGSGEFYTVTQASIGNVDSYKLKEITPKGQLAVIWLNGHGATGKLLETTTNEYTGSTIDICWSTTGNPGVVATLLFKNSSSEYLVGKAAFSPDAGRTDSFDTAVTSGSSLCGAPVSDGAVYKKTLILADLNYSSANDVLLALRMRPVYSDAQLYAQAQSGLRFPAQGNVYTATGEVKGTTRKVQVDQVYSAPSSLFDYVIYSQNGDFSQ